jgi:hypothetical protein
MGVQQAEPVARVISRRKHPRAVPKHHAPLKRMHRETGVDLLAEAIWPWHWAAYPGLLKGLWGLFGPRAAKVTIRDWRRGRRGAPVWALDLLIAEARKRVAVLSAAIERAEKEKTTRK